MSYIAPETRAKPSSADISTAGPKQTFFVLRRHARAISVTYMLTLAENGVRLSYPLVIGFTIDALLKGQTWMILAVVGIWLAHLTIALTRLLYDTHAFTRAYSDLVQHTVASQRQDHVQPEIIAARVSLSRDLVSFFEFGVRALMNSVFGLVGSAFMLGRQDLTIGLMVVVVLLPVMGVYTWFGKRSLRLHRLLNNQIEREIGLIARLPLASVARHLAKLRTWRLRISVGEAATEGVVDLCSLVLCVVLLVRLSSAPGVTPGQIYAALAYLFDFSMAVSTLPRVVQHAAHVRDIWRRLTT